MSYFKKNCVTLWVVGNRLKEFSNNKNIISLSELELLINSNLLNSHTTQYVINYVQGVNELRLQILNLSFLCKFQSDIKFLNL